MLDNTLFCDNIALMTNIEESLQKWNGRFKKVKGAYWWESSADKINFETKPLTAEMLVHGANLFAGRCDFYTGYVPKEIIISSFVPDESLNPEQRATAIEIIKDLNDGIPDTIRHEVHHFENNQKVPFWEMGFNMTELASFHIHDEISARFLSGVYYWDSIGLEYSPRSANEDLSTAFNRAVSDFYYENCYKNMLQTMGLRINCAFESSRLYVRAMKKLDNPRFNHPLYHGALRIYYTYDLPSGERRCVLDDLSIEQLREFYGKVLSKSAEYLKKIHDVKNK